MIEDIKRTDGWMALSSFSSLGSDVASMVSPEMKAKIVAQIASEIGRTEREVAEFIELNNGRETEQVESDDESYLHDEYQAFHGNYDKAAGANRDFQVEEAMGGYDYMSLGIRSVFMVKAIREVRALLGFTRLRPVDSDEESGDDNTGERPVAVPVSERNLNWLPAVEVRGEGIFLAFDEKILDTWSKQDAVLGRMRTMNDHYRRSCEARGKTYEAVTAKRVFLHTLAHLLIRQLSFECGYASASLRERIYCDSGGPNPMQGILIYTAAGDADGTLGGLVRQARSDRFPQTLQSALENAAWCSNDPLCAASHGQGFESLNLAACYACGLLAETSCETFNKFLDRALVVGLPGESLLGFFENKVRESF